MLKKICLVVCLILLVFILACETEEAGKKVLLIYSYDAEYPWVIEETRGTEDILKEKPVEIEKFYLDTKRNTSIEWLEQVAEDAVNKINDFKPDLVIVFDDNACELIAKRYIDKTLPIVFCGMNGEPQDYGFPAQNITGVVERHHLKESIDLLKRLVPDITRISIITDNSPTSQAFIARSKESVLPIGIDEFYVTDDFETWKAKIIELQSNVHAIGLAGYHTLKERGAQTSIPGEQVLQWTLDNSRLPEFAVNEFTVIDGALCGVTLSGYEQGRTAAEIAVKILNGQKPADIPITYPEKGNPIVNDTRAKELDIVVSTDVLKDVEIAH